MPARLPTCLRLSVDAFSLNAERLTTTYDATEDDCRANDGTAVWTLYTPVIPPAPRGVSSGRMDSSMVVEEHSGNVWPKRLRTDGASKRE